MRFLLWEQRRRQAAWMSQLDVSSSASFRAAGLEPDGLRRHRRREPRGRVLPRAQERKLKAAQLETRLIEARLKTLEAELHPHFLFNTLHAISTLMHRDPESADRMISRLSDLLRITFDRSGEPKVSLKEEMEFLQKYLDIEQTRFQDRLTVHVRRRPDALDARSAADDPAAARRERDQARHRRPRTGGDNVQITRRPRRRARCGCRCATTAAGSRSRTLKALRTGVGLSNTRARLDCLYGRHYRARVHRHARRALGPDRDSLPARRRPRASHRRPSAWREMHMHMSTRRHEFWSSTTSRSRASGCARCCRTSPASRSSARPATASHGASTPITALSPDLVFLDVQMPGADGFDVIDAVGADKMPMVVFVTAYDRYALRAFDVHALDYLLKPFDRERFRAGARARARSSSNAAPAATSSAACSRSSRT